MAGLLSSQPPSGGLLSLLGPDARRQALFSGLTQAGAGLMQGGQPNALAALGQGLGGFNQGFSGDINRQIQERLLMDQFGEKEREQQRRAAMADALTGMEDVPPEIEALIRPMAQTDPEGAWKFYQDYMLKQAGQTPQGAESPLGKLAADFAAGRITKEQYDAGVKKANYITPPANTTINVGPTGVDYGDPEAGLAWARNPDGTVRLDERGAPIALPYQGGKPYAEQQKAEQAAAGQAAATLQVGDVVLTDIGRVKEKIEKAPWYAPTTGLVGNILKDVGGTRAADVRALTDTVRANIGFDRLQAMRDASPTGGALGQVTERELGQLQAVLGSLEQTQTEGQLLFNLDRLEKIYTDIVKKAEAYPNAAEFGFGGGGEQPASPFTGMSDEQVLEELRKMGYAIDE
jgi:hypothetical protein